MNSRVIVLLAALIVAVAAFGGCGGDDDGDSPSSVATTNSEGGSEETDSGSATDGQDGGEAGDGAEAGGSSAKAEFIAQANVACKRAGKDLFEDANDYYEKNLSKGLPEMVLTARTIRATFVPITEDQLAAVRQLQPPPGEEQEVEAMLAAQEAAIEEAKELKKARDLGTAEAFFGDASEMLEAYGLTECTAGL